MTNSNLESVLSYTRQNSGTHFLDSGGAYGRHWQSDAPSGMFTVDDSEYWSGATLSLSHIIAEYYDFHTELQALVDEVWNHEDGAVLFTDVSVDAYDRLPADLRNHVTILPDDARNVDDCTYSVHVDGADLGFFDVATLVLTLRGYVQEARDNAYNGENDLDQVFIWECWVPEHAAGGDWVWTHDALMVVYAHTGCDVRGGYASPMILDCDSSDGECNYIETRVGYWPANEATEEYCIDEGLEGHFEVGYSSSPTYHLESAMGDFVRWDTSGDSPVAIFKHPTDDAVELSFSPCYYPA